MRRSIRSPPGGVPEPTASMRWSRTSTKPSGKRVRRSSSVTTRRAPSMSVSTRASAIRPAGPALLEEGGDALFAVPGPGQLLEVHALRARERLGDRAPGALAHRPPREGEHGATAQAPAVHRGDGRLGDLVEEEHEAMERAEYLTDPLRAMVGDVHAGRERARQGRAEDEHLEVLPRGKTLQRPPDLSHGRDVEHVHRRPAEREPE